MRVSDLVFATGNENKVKEVQALLGKGFQVKSLKDIGCTEEIPEPHETLEENAIEKVTYVLTNYGLDCFSEDTGLEVFALNGAPGVYSARYAGPEKSSDQNITKLLHELEGETDRRARFRTVIALLIDDQQFTFEGIVNGTIATTRSGNGGFGYDPVFIPDGYDRSFAEMSLDEKSKISHRGRAIEKLTHFLQSY